MAKVSILVPIYGVERFIEKCAVSLFEQTFQNIEFIFVNDQTKDQSIEILENVISHYPVRQNQVKIINHKVNKGLAGARNTGIENASGEYILHVDSDDYLELNAIEMLYTKALEENADVVVCDFFLEWEKEQKRVTQVLPLNKSDFVSDILKAKAVTAVWNKLIRRELYIKNNIRAIEGINLGEDFVTIPKLIFSAKKIAKVDEALYHYIQTNSNSYTKQLSESNINNLVSVYSELEFFFKDKPNSVEYLSAMQRSKLIKKIEFLLQSNDRNFGRILDLFKDVNNIKNIDFLNFRDKIVFFLMQKNYRIILKSYVKIYGFLFLIVQKMKGR